MKPVISMLVLVLCVVSVRAEDTSDSDFKQLIDRMGHDRLKVRDEAEAALKKAGRRALPELRRAVEGHREPEVRFRARSVIRYITQIHWSTNLESALKTAASENKPMLVFSTGGDMDGYT